MSGLAARASRLIAELVREQRALSALVAELIDVGTRLVERIDRRDAVLVAVDLHHYFTAVETAFERIARDIDEELPQGPDSHRLLIEQMAIEVPALRPAVIQDSERQWLQGLRGFRHFFRNAYAAELSSEELRRHADLVGRHHAALMAAFDSFLAFLDSMRR